MPLPETHFLFCRPLVLTLTALCLLTVAQTAPAAELSTSARSRLFLDKKDPPPKVTPMQWDQPENYDSPANLVEELPPAVLELLGFTPLRIEPTPPTTPRVQVIATGLVSAENGVKAGLSFARRATADGVCRVFVSKETAVALDDTTFVQWHERSHCDRGYKDRELEESKANVQGYLMMAKTGDLWYAWQSIDNRARLIGDNKPFFAPYRLGYRVASSTILPLLKRRGGPKQELGYELVTLLSGMSERQVNALAMLLVEDAKRKQLDGKTWTPFTNAAAPD
ncbi:hypothetical protein [Ferribacterium limneticum]|uniref:hypothetical protein n=1 Tax=Ferribacterium limneticum TaxID=76259 RepID=UPI001CF8EE91|nr:hypothetical protein [Ferribacterium limneticum]UCV21472.1 hypothetical protein KI613_13065 [Ferribacterium limneticum]